MTSTLVIIIIILVRSQIDAWTLTEVERNEKNTYRGIQKKIMRARSTLDWSQSNNIFSNIGLCRPDSG